MNLTHTALVFKQLTPILIVEEIEPCLRFWIDRLDFAVTIQVPGASGKLQFAALVKGGIEIMYQTRAVALTDAPTAADELAGHGTVLYLTVQNLNAVEAALAGAPIVKARHETAYGSSEIYVRAPGGNRVGFSQPG